MNSAPKPHDNSLNSEAPMQQQNDTAKSEGIQEPILLPSADKSLPSSSHVEDWRELARQIQDEADSSKIVNLVEQLITKFDEQNARTLRTKSE